MVLFIGKYKFELAYLAYPSNDLARPDLISFINADSGQITIRCEIFSVADDHRIDISDIEDAGNLSFKHGFYGSAGIDINGNPLVIMDNTFYIFVRTKGHGDRARHRPGQMSFIFFKIPREVHILIAGEYRL